MSGTNIPSASVLACILACIFTCFLRPLPATSVNQCPASSLSHAETSLEIKHHFDSLIENEQVNLLQAQLTVQPQMFTAENRPQHAQAVYQSREHSDFDCKTYPKMCEAPFACDTMNKISPTNGPNFQAWCFAPEYDNYIHECLVTKDLVRAAQIQYESTKAGKFGSDMHELDGSYCFIEGHCLNTRVTNNTTLEEANQMCDERYGRSTWENFGKFASQDVSLPSHPEDKSNGFNSQKQTTPFLLSACAMGNYHCDVMYCRETYCKDELMVKKYGHFLKDLGWEASKASWLKF